MDFTSLKLQQQSRCINQLSNYIDQLETTIEQLKTQIEQLKKQIHPANDMSYFVSDKYKNSNQLVRIMNEQMLIVEKEKKRCREEVKAKNRELQSQKELLQMQIDNLRNIYEQKLSFLEGEWSAKQNDLRQEIKFLENQNERLTEENSVCKSKLKNIDQCQQMLRIRKQIIELQNSRLKESRMSEDDQLNHSHYECQIQFETERAENVKLRNQNQVLEFQLRHIKRQMQRDAELITNLRQEIKNLENKISRDQNIYSISQKSSEIHSKVLNELQSLKKERQISMDLLQTTQSIKQYNFFKSKQFQRLRKKEEEELSKISNIFQCLDFNFS